MKIILTAFAITVCLYTNAQECSVENSKKYQQNLNEEYADPKKSPLLKEDLAAFESLDFYPVDLSYCVEAKLVRTPDEKPFKMPTTGSRKPMYVKYGELHFTLKGKKCKLDVLQSIDLSKLDEYKDYLFLAFTDLTSGNGSYGGGRYIDLKIPQGDTMNIDFNTAYNPYCAYNHGYSCPIPPKQNDLQVEVKAGVRMKNSK
ncbi:DUF1684 domain-containing protein [Flavobacterium sp. MFBS3-15]|uniref:DUF1684 domain-containing protein n=1 Tax=Flavobacterium sp. MFBS3-15 TaxID=2989816 RepID=UPI002235E5D5|nr:DUF1684 domain-containing protein [Flavobacterium sp. MFBS3-15]MCW4467727.1 DUF1684 domain-containing protein [Flavobacterium sp. MFBS3-15]